MKSLLTLCVHVSVCVHAHARAYVYISKKVYSRTLLKFGDPAYFIFVYSSGSWVDSVCLRIAAGELLVEQNHKCGSHHIHALWVQGKNTSFAGLWSLDTLGSAQLLYLCPSCPGACWLMNRKQSRLPSLVNQVPRCICCAQGAVYGYSKMRSPGIREFARVSINSQTQNWERDSCVPLKCDLPERLH